MSTRSLNYRPCPDCHAETLHNVTRCLTCQRDNAVAIDYVAHVIANHTKGTGRHAKYAGVMNGLRAIERAGSLAASIERVRGDTDARMYADDRIERARHNHASTGHGKRRP